MYDVLGVAAATSGLEIMVAYWRLAAACHPDAVVAADRPTSSCGSTRPTRRSPTQTSAPSMIEGSSSPIRDGGRSILPDRRIPTTPADASRGRGRWTIADCALSIVSTCNLLGSCFGVALHKFNEIMGQAFESRFSLEKDHSEYLTKYQSSPSFPRSVTLSAATRFLARPLEADRSREGAILGRGFAERRRLFADLYRAHGGCGSRSAAFVFLVSGPLFFRTFGGLATGEP
ncbi:hypothetical protein ZIOFF_060177 [Zingiber officinale]|uniref:J domain-containing protein n=1 Tax=Zingiber officinale TaxID=94328 RepID=A0A8J5KKV3_ZINOF|nr:hypothetical protein ZIOFF_060177 [Zingiber officinale]